MPSLAALHPQVVHFVVALIIVGRGAALGVARRRRGVADAGGDRRWSPSAPSPAWWRCAPAATRTARSSACPARATRWWPTRRGVSGRATSSCCCWRSKRWPPPWPAASTPRPATPPSPPPPSAWWPSACSTAPPISAVSWSYGYGGGVGIRSGDPQDVSRAFIAGALSPGGAGSRRRPPARCRRPTCWPRSRSRRAALAQVEPPSIAADPSAALDRLDASTVDAATTPVARSARRPGGPRRRRPCERAGSSQVLETLRTIPDRTRRSSSACRDRRVPTDARAAAPPGRAQLADGLATPSSG